MFKIVAIFTMLGGATFTEEAGPFESLEVCKEQLHATALATKVNLGDAVIYDIHSDGTVYMAVKSTNIIGKCVNA